jgi:anti-sigma factor RsiW
MAEADDVHTAFEADFSDLYDKALPRARAGEVEAHLAACERCRAEYQKFQDALGALSGLHRVPAPPNFDDQVAETIHRRSAGRFFGRRAFGDRVPFELLALLALIAVLVAFFVLRGRS